MAQAAQPAQRAGRGREHADHLAGKGLGAAGPDRVALDGAGQFDAGTYVFRLRVSDIQRMVSLEDNVVHHALTLDVFQKA